MATAKDKLIAGAQKLVEKGQFEKAIKEYLKVVQQDDKDVRIWLKIGDLYAKIGRKTEATETYSRVAQFYSDQGFYLKSVAVYKQILKIDPRLVEVNQRLAELYKQLGLLSDAMMQYETVAAFFHREGKTRDALAALKQIVELDPETVANRIKLAELYSKEGMAREAIDEFSRAAEQLRNAGRTDDFMKVAERLLFHSPDNRPISKELARLYIEKGDPRRALPKLQVCFKADPRDTEVLNLLAKAFESLDQRSKAVSVLKELARILGENGDAAGRIEVYRRILDLEPGDPEAEQVLSGVRRPITGAFPTRAESEPSAAKRPPPAPPVDFGQPPPTPITPWSQRRPEPDLRHQTDELPPSAVHEFDDRRVPIDDLEDLGAPGPQPITKTGVGQILDGDQAPRRSHDEEVERILNETDVYIKYKLYTKAIEHVQRVFDLDPHHVEAREKLKALFLTVGKKEEAIGELWSLAEQAEAGRQRRYLREIIELEPSNARAAGLLGVEPSEAAPLPASGAYVEEEIEELHSDEFNVADPSQVTSVPDDDLIPVVVEPMRDAAHDDDGHEPSLEDRFSLADEPIEDRFGLGDEASEEVAVPMPPTDSEEHAVDEGLSALASHAHPAESDEHDLHTRFEDQAVKFLEQPGEMFDEVDESELPPVAPIQTTGTPTHRAPLEEILEEEERRAGRRAPSTHRDLPSIAAASPLGGASARPPPTPSEDSRRAAPPAPRAETNLEDDLDEADFFVQQSLFDEARAILDVLLERHPGHPLVNAKMRDLEAMERAAGGGAPRAPEPEPEPVIEESMPPSSSLSAELPDELPGSTDSAMPMPEGTPPEPFEITRKGVIEKGVTAEDFETHYDLGIAYKEMGLLDDAVTEFKMCMKDPTREVQCHLMIGLCCLEKGQQTEAIGHFKKGLYVEGITDREALSLYFELGQAYERLGDPREALYYYEKVVKRDPRFRNIEKHIEALRGREANQGSAPHQTTASASHDDVENAFDSLLGEDA